MKVAVVVLVLASGCLISPVYKFGGPSTKQAQRTTLTRETPPAIVVEGEWSGTVATAPIHVWADDDYRAQNVRWRETFQTELDAINEVLAAQFGVRLSADFRPWNRHVPGATLSDALDALAALDPGADAFAVVGLVSSVGLVAATFEQLGVAHQPGRHLVVRGYADGEERKAFEQLFRDLGEDERAALYAARRRHKTTALFLHELGHNLGAAHRAEADTLMSPAYSHHAASFDAASRAAILASIDERLHRSRPGGRPSQGAPVVGDLVIVVDTAGRRLVGGNALDDKTLDGLLELTFGDDPQSSIVVVPQSGAPPRVVEDVERRARAAGLTRVSVSPP